MVENTGAEIIKQLIQIAVLLYIIRWLYNILKVELFLLKDKKKTKKTRGKTRKK